MLTMKTRSYIYGIILAVIPVLTVLGITIPGNIDMWLALASAILGLGGVGLARANVAPSHKEVAIIAGGPAPAPAEPAPVYTEAFSGEGSISLDRSVYETETPDSDQLSESVYAQEGI